MDPVIFLTVELHMRPFHSLHQCQWVLGISEECWCHFPNSGMSGHISGKDLCFLPLLVFGYYFPIQFFTSVGIRMIKDLRDAFSLSLSLCRQM